MEWTQDGFLGGQLTVRQPKKGFRAGSDAVLLAASILDKGSFSVLDVGCGVGTAGLCVKWRYPDCQVYGIEFQKILLKAATHNFEQNQLANGFTAIDADIGNKTDFCEVVGPNDRPFLQDSFDHVITNPPFYEDGKAQLSENNIRSLAHVEGEVALAQWLKFCVARVKPKGQISIIHRTDRLADILNALGGICGAVQIIPLWPNSLTPAKRVLIQAIKGDKSAPMLLPGVILHEMDGQPTKMSENILREGKSLGDICN
jgi:tRNA1(Val) A37 N6-methylase TrmN6